MASTDSPSSRTLLKTLVGGNARWISAAWFAFCALGIEMRERKRNGALRDMKHSRLSLYISKIKKVAPETERDDR